MRDSILRRFIGRLRTKNVSRRGASRRTRQLAFESFEARQMFSASEIVIENGLTGADNWLVRAPSVPGERAAAPNSITWNGFTDSTQQTYNDRIQGYTSRISYDLSEPELAIDFKVDAPGTTKWDVEIHRLGHYGGKGAPWSKD